MIILSLYIYVYLSIVSVLRVCSLRVLCGTIWRWSCCCWTLGVHWDCMSCILRISRCCCVRDRLIHCCSVFNTNTPVREQQPLICSSPTPGTPLLPIQESIFTTSNYFIKNILLFLFFSIEAAVRHTIFNRNIVFGQRLANRHKLQVNTRPRQTPFTCRAERLQKLSINSTIQM